MSLLPFSFILFPPTLYFSFHLSFQFLFSCPLSFTEARNIIFPHLDETPNSSLLTYSQMSKCTPTLTFHPSPLCIPPSPLSTIPLPLPLPYHPSTSLPQTLFCLSKYDVTQQTHTHLHIKPIQLINPSRDFYSNQNKAKANQTKTNLQAKLNKS